MADRDYFLAGLDPKRYDRLLDVSQFPTLLNLPEMQNGDYAIRHVLVPAGKRINMSAGGFVRFGTDIMIRQLFHKNKLWMSDSPSETSDMRDLVRMALPGHVLVAGLGMGLVATMLAEERGIDQVTVVEIAPEVANMISPYLPDKVRVITADFREWLKTANTSIYSSAILDIWGDISTDDLSDMVNLWEQTGLRCGGIWGFETLFYRLLDELRHLNTHEELVDALHEMKLSQIANYIEEYCSGSDWYDDDEYYSDDALTEAFANVYGFDVW